MNNHYSYVRNQTQKPNQFLDQNVPHSTKGLSTAAASYKSFGPAVMAQLHANLGTNKLIIRNQ